MLRKSVAPILVLVSMAAALAAPPAHAAQKTVLYEHFTASW